MNPLRCITEFASRFFLGCAVLVSPLFAQTFTTIHNFAGTDGQSPTWLIQGPDGNLYGSSVQGGSEGQGVVFKMTPTGAIETIYNFCQLTNCTDGAEPFAAPILGPDGNLYGTTNLGGASSTCVGCGSGTVYQLTFSGTLTTLHSFDSGDGAQPQGGLTLGDDGNYYGTTLNGGTRGWGTLYRISPGGSFTALHNFERNVHDGGNPYTAPIQASDGNFYGVTYDGGPTDGGDVYRFTLSGAFQNIYNFCSVTNCGDGYYPLGALAEGPDGQLYGTTSHGVSTACLGGCGTIFEITHTGTLTTLHAFSSSDGATPISQLVFASNGVFYGTTTYGGGGTSCGSSVGCGTFYSLTPAGTFTSLYAFCLESGCPDGAEPANGPLLQDTSGVLYATTPLGGGSNDGTAFSWSDHLPPFIVASPSFGSVGSTISILGNHLGSVTSVTFNGTSASFTIVSPTEITATVPAGATSGRVRVAAPAGTLTTNTMFRVLP